MAAAGIFLSTKELLEMMLQCLNNADLHRAERVCQDWRTLIATSPTLQQQMFYAPVPDSAKLVKTIYTPYRGIPGFKFCDNGVFMDGIDSGDPNDPTRLFDHRTVIQTIHPFLAHLTRTPDSDLEAHHRFTEECEWKNGFPNPQFFAKLQRLPSKRWRSALFTQPPATAVVLLSVMYGDTTLPSEQSEYFRKMIGRGGGLVRIEDPTGIKLGQLVDALQAMAEESVSYFAHIKKRTADVEVRAVLNITNMNFTPNIGLALRGGPEGPDYIKELPDV